MRNATWLVGLVVVLSAGQASAQRLPFTWDVPKVVESVDVPGVMKADGIPVKLRSVKSAENPEVIARHLIDRFKAWGFYIPPAHHQKQLLRDPHFTALDPERFISYTFVLQPNQDGTTTVLMGEANLSQPARKESPIAPVFPGAQEVVTSNLEVARSLTYSVAGKTQQEVEAFYAQELEKVGYRQTGSNRYRSGTDELQVTVRPSKAGMVSVVVLRRTVTEEVHNPHAD